MKTTRPKLSLPFKKSEPRKETAAARGLDVSAAALKVSAAATAPLPDSKLHSETKVKERREFIAPNRPKDGPHSATIKMRKLLVKRWPKCFAGFKKPKRPLQIGIHITLLELTYGCYPQVVMNAIGDYTSGPTYLKAVIEGADRIDLEGNPAGKVTAEEEKYAQEQLAKLGVRHDS
jgi:ProP effector